MTANSPIPALARQRPGREPGPAPASVHSTLTGTDPAPYPPCGSRDQCRVGAVIMIKRTSGPIYALVIALLMVPTVVVALMADCALAAEMPKDFQGTWCTSSDTLKDDWGAYNTEGADCEGQKCHYDRWAHVQCGFKLCHTGDARPFCCGRNR